MERIESGIPTDVRAGFREISTYIAALIFVVGNIILPQICHLIPQGGITWLPIYFFTLVGAYTYGWKVGLLTAVASPIVNSLLFGMPVVGNLPVIEIKSVLLAVVAGLVASKNKKVTLLILLVVVLGYQIPGSFAEWLITGDLSKAVQDFRIGIPGMILQIAGGYVVIRKILNRL